MLSSYEFAPEEILSNPRVRPLRLRQVDAAGAAALRDLFGRRDVLRIEADELTWRFGWLARGQLPRGLLMRGESIGLTLRLAEDGLRNALGCREWWDYEESSSLLAWTLSHPLLLDSLSRLLGDSLQPDGWIEQGADPTDTPPAVLAFSVTTLDGRQASGELALPWSALTRLSAHPGWQTQVPDLQPWATSLKAELRVVLSEAAFPAREVLAARPGDMLVLGPRTACWRRLVVIYTAKFAPLPSSVSRATRRIWQGSYEPGRIEIAALMLDDSRRTIMSEHTSEETASEAAAGALEGIPVTLDFDVGSLAVPLGELAAIKPGYVFELPSPLEEARVVIKANGTPIGHGELVAVGDTLGVQLLTIDTRGFR